MGPLPVLRSRIDASRRAQPLRSSGVSMPPCPNESREDLSGIRPTSTDSDDGEAIRFRRRVAAGHGGGDPKRDRKVRLAEPGGLSSCRYLLVGTGWIRLGGGAEWQGYGLGRGAMSRACLLESPSFAARPAFGDSVPV